MIKPFLAFLASSVNPVLLFVFATSVAEKLPTRNCTKAFLTRSGAALLITYFLSHISRWMHLWKDHDSFPSGHMTFYFAVATSFFLLDRRSALFTIPLALLYSWLIVFLGFHFWLDIWGALFLAVPVTLLCHWNRGGSSANNKGT